MAKFKPPRPSTGRKLLEARAKKPKGKSAGKTQAQREQIARYLKGEDRGYESLPD